MVVEVKVVVVVLSSDADEVVVVAELLDVVVTVGSTADIDVADDELVEVVATAARKSGTVDVVVTYTGVVELVVVDVVVVSASALEDVVVAYTDVDDVVDVTARSTTLAEVVVVKREDVDVETKFEELVVLDGRSAKSAAGEEDVDPALDVVVPPDELDAEVVEVEPVELAAVVLDAEVVDELEEVLSGDTTPANNVIVNPSVGTTLAILR